MYAVKTCYITKVSKLSNLTNSALPTSLCLTVKNWNSIIKSGSWLGSKGTSGGCRNFPTFTDNPQFIIDLTEDADGDGKCSCLIALMQKHRRKQKKMGVQDLCIGFSLYKVLSFSSLPV